MFSVRSLCYDTQTALVLTDIDYRGYLRNVAIEGILLFYNETPRSKLRGIIPGLTSFVISLLRSKLRGIKPSFPINRGR